MAKRGVNIYKRKDGRWEGRYKCGYKPDGKPKYRSVYGKSYSAVRTLLDKRRYETDNSLPVCRYTVEELMQCWISDVRAKVKESTYANYLLKLEKHILPYFGKMKYEALTAQELNMFIQNKLSYGLSEKYVSDIVIILKSAAKFGSRNYGYANRIEYAALPKAERKEERPMLSRTEQRKLTSALINDKTLSNTGILLASATGIRIGELCALKWSDIDLEKSVMTVSRTVQRIKSTGTLSATKITVSSPKSAKSNREIPLPDFILPILKEKQEKGSSYILSGTETPTEPRTMQYRFKSLLKRTKLPDVNFHSLRHMFATNCIETGVDVKTLSEILGHSSVEITLNRYVHSSMERKKSCMKLFSDSFFSV